MTADIKQLIRKDVAAKEEKRQQLRQTFPGTASLVDELRQVFPGVKVKWAKEGDSEIGRREPFDGWDADKIISLDDWNKHAAKRKRK